MTSDSKTILKQASPSRSRATQRWLSSTARLSENNLIPRKTEQSENKDTQKEVGTAVESLADKRRQRTNMLRQSQRSINIFMTKLEISEDERKYLLSVEKGDMPAVRQSLEEAYIFYNININCDDQLGRTAMHIAVENENVEMMELLLSHGVKIGDTLLHAINKENVEAVTLLLNSQAKSGRKALVNILGQEPSDSFTSDITPLILAGQRDNYEITKILLDRGEKISRPHDIRCKCRDCQVNRREDSLRHSRSRINTYKALCSPSYICLTSTDPIYTAFIYCHEMLQLSTTEPEFHEDYLKLARRCQAFATSLLDQTRSTRELTTVLNYNHRGSASTEGKHRMTLHRLKMAIDLKQKKFVAHANVQQLLSSIFYAGLPSYQQRSALVRILFICLVAVSYPVLSLCHIIWPHSKGGRLIEQPFIKFICHSAGFLTFLALLILKSQRIEDAIGLATESNFHGAPPTILDWIIYTMIIGFVWEELRQLYHEGFRSHVSDLWNWLDFLTNSMYLGMMSCRIVAYFLIYKDERLANIHRSEWVYDNPILMSECLFALANTLSQLKLLQMFTVNSQIGPIQLSFGRIIIDIIKFGALFLMVFLAFATGLNQLYASYAKLREKECVDNGELPDCEENNHRTINNLFGILETLWWSLFSLVDIKNFALKENHVINQLVGKVLFGIYSGLAIIVLINMLIAMMTNTFTAISNEQDLEWKFARSKLWLSYFEEYGTVPPPLNLIPSPSQLWSIIKAICCAPRDCILELMQRDNPKEPQKKDLQHEQVMRQLVRRYIMRRQRESMENHGVTEEDINEVKQDIGTFRYELVEMLKNNGMVLSQASVHGQEPQAASTGKTKKKAVEKFQRQIAAVAAASKAIKEEAITDQAKKALQKLAAFSKESASSLGQRSSSDNESISDWKLDDEGFVGSQTQLTSSLTIETAPDSAVDNKIDEANISRIPTVTDELQCELSNGSIPLDEPSSEIKEPV